MTKTRRRILLIGLIATATALLATGAMATLGHLRDDAPAREALERHATTERSEGAALLVTLDVDAPLAPLDPVTIHAAPALARALPVADASLARDASFRVAGLAAGAGIDLAAGKERTRATDAPSTMGAASQRAVLLPGSASVAAAAAAFTLAGALAYFWSSVKPWLTRLALAPALALYAKITRAEVFDNGVRERIFSAIRDNPGLSASDLARVAGVSWGTTIYHLEVLEQTRMVTSLRKGRYRRYFENGATLDASKDVVAILRNPVTASVVDTIRNAPGATQKELALATNMSPQALHWHIVRLVESGVVRKERHGRVVRHFV